MEMDNGYVHNMNWDFNPYNPRNARRPELTKEKKRAYMESKPENQPLTVNQFKTIRTIEWCLDITFKGYSKADATQFINMYKEKSMASRKRQT